ncbi:hypothetical protein N8A98_05215 [Devosia neptuniae]|uniref:Uncharacterized protein n=1 Tax=Devosia neptuniae TaxID=191302 RepID=A0ABY6CEC1_9HYPH|nr:hypothetical protein [Devosia neptuniae]UXN70595.1 hypothetical protein N8A98_05215 [Devosia neptuniae]
MWAANAEDALIELCGAVTNASAQDSLTIEQVAANLRNWPFARGFASELFAGIADPIRRARAIEVLDKYELLRERRHRSIHDAIDVGVFEVVGGGYLVQALQIGFVGTRQKTRQVLSEITPEVLANLASELYELYKDMDALIYELRA